MNVTKKLEKLILLVVWCAVPAVGFTAPCAGINVNSTYEWEQKEIGEGSTLATWKAKSVVVSDDPDAPFHLIAGECNGSFLTTPDGMTQGRGNCVRKDKDGDVLYENYIQHPNKDNKADISNAGGTGKFANAKSTAVAQVVRFYQPLSMAAVRWEGDCQ